eukprot:comp19697_c0_seq2/m.23411 comp19697_c0_seq2/g.23411  ORF comp19697_c0_seq2/g.23411 comp19697_c0_seq2/m.23411 type:complete len:291 (-) comp19697_c0_seq2:111-983(-)
MMRVVLWYMTAFHEGRKGNVAKKPYNPIIGETFRCQWRLEESGLGTVVYIAEQVSHHPPVSAFYVENLTTQVSLNAHIWTKSKFLGTSIGVSMVGQGIITLHTHSEEYLVTFPSAYARSILTIPWVELGGHTVIECSKTGYKATIEFLTKPTFGGETHRISCNVIGPSSSQPIVRIGGKWNGQLHVLPQDGQAQKAELFADTAQIPVIKKACAPLHEQGDFESRRLWHEVTLALRDRDMDRATFYKSKLEARQREEAQQRAQTGEKWKTKLFHQDQQGVWSYDHALGARK